MEKIRFYILSKNGAMLHPKIINLLVGQVKKIRRVGGLGLWQCL